MELRLASLLSNPRTPPHSFGFSPSRLSVVLRTILEPIPQQQQKERGVGNCPPFSEHVLVVLATVLVVLLYESGIYMKYVISVRIITSRFPSFQESVFSFFPCGHGLGCSNQLSACSLILGENRIKQKNNAIFVVVKNYCKKVLVEELKYNIGDGFAGRE